MRGLVVVSVLVALVLSGCSNSPKSGLPSVDGPANAALDESQFQDVNIKVSATTGAIRGVVVDAAIAPIADAKVSVGLKVGNQTVASDTQGRFTFSDLPAGTYFLAVSHPLYHKTQTSVQVVADDPAPAVIKVQLQPIFSQKPFTVQIKHKGFFECSQAGIGLYSSSNCVTDYCPIFQDPKTCNGLPTSALNNVTSQDREWHSDVLPGWQNQVFEMTWTSTSQGTSQNMGMTVSTFKPERDPSHWFASVAGPNPMRFQLDVGKVHESASGVEPTNISADGMTRMSYFVSVRTPDGSVCVFDCVPPGLAINQDFEVFLTQFYYGLAPEAWSVVAGDPVPF